MFDVPRSSLRPGLLRSQAAAPEAPRSLRPAPSMDLSHLVARPITALPRGRANVSRVKLAILVVSGRRYRPAPMQADDRDRVRQARDAAVRAKLAASREARYCESCGEPIILTDRGTARFCSEDCRMRAAELRRLAKANAAVSIERATEAVATSSRESA